MVDKIRNILEAAFPGITVLTETLPDGRISGSVVWAGFDGLDEVDRQCNIRKVLQQALDADVVKVGVLLTYTPDELDAMNAA